MSATDAKSKTAGMAASAQVPRPHHVRCSPHRCTTVRIFSGDDDDELANVEDTIQQLYGKMGFYKKKKNHSPAILVINPRHLPIGKARATFVAEVCHAGQSCV
jgi:hypothetical protein